MTTYITRHRKPMFLVIMFTLMGLALVSGLAPSAVSRQREVAFATQPSATIVAGADVSVIHDNDNVDGAEATPSFDARNFPQMETSIAISPANRNIIVIAYNDARFVDLTFGYWIGLSVSTDGGATWFNTVIPGYLTDTSSAGQVSPIKGSYHTADPTVRFDAAGNLYVSGLFNKYQPTGTSQAKNSGIFLARYEYTPGTPQGVSTPTSAADPSDFTYSRTTVVDWGVRGSLPAEAEPINVGQLDDKPWFAIDTDPSTGGFGTIYCAFTRLLAGQWQLVLKRSVDQGLTFETSQPIAQKGIDGTNLALSASFALAKGGRVYVAYRTFARFAESPGDIRVVRSNDFGKHFDKPTIVARFVPLPRFSIINSALGVFSLACIAVDETDANIVYVTYPAMNGSTANGDIFIARSTDGARTWEPSVKVNDDSTNKHQYFPSIAVSRGVVHIAWYDLRDSLIPSDPWTANDVENVYYASSNVPGSTYPAFTPNLRVTDIGSNPNCQGTSPFGGYYGRDYLEVAAWFDGVNHIALVAWGDNRDIPPAKCPTAGPPPTYPDASGAANSNIFTDRIVVTP